MLHLNIHSPSFSPHLMCLAVYLEPVSSLILADLLIFTCHGTKLISFCISISPSIAWEHLLINRIFLFDVKRKQVESSAILFCTLEKHGFTLFFVYNLLLYSFFHQAISCCEFNTTIFVSFGFEDPHFERFLRLLPVMHLGNCHIGIWQVSNLKSLLELLPLLPSIIIKMRWF